MTIRNPEVFALDGSKFDWHKDIKTATIEVSELGILDSRQIYDDACDVGISIRSPKTGKCLWFYHDKTDMNGDDVAGWRFKAIPEHVRGLPWLKEWTILIIND